MGRGQLSDERRSGAGHNGQVAKIQMTYDLQQVVAIFDGADHRWVDALGA